MANLGDGGLYVRPGRELSQAWSHHRVDQRRVRIGIERTEIDETLHPPGGIIEPCDYGGCGGVEVARTDLGFEPRARVIGYVGVEVAELRRHFGRLAQLLVSASPIRMHPGQAE